MAKTILVIDDNNDLRENTAEILDLAGYKTLTAENGKRGVEVATREKPDVIVCDIMMPELDGYAATAVIRQTGNNNSYNVTQTDANAYILVRQSGNNNAVTDVVRRP